MLSPSDKTNEIKGPSSFLVVNRYPPPPPHRVSKHFMVLQEVGSCSYCKSAWLFVVSLCVWSTVLFCIAVSGSMCDDSLRHSGFDLAPRASNPTYQTSGTHLPCFGCLYVFFCCIELTCSFCDLDMVLL